MLFTLHHYNERRDRQAGASMPEFALSFPVIILMIAFLIDAGLYLFQNALLTDATAALNRQITTALGQRDTLSNASCGELKAMARSVKGSVTSATAVLYKDMEFDLQLLSSNPSPYRLVTLFGTFTFRCLSCKFFDIAGVGLPIVSTSVQVIERPGNGACGSFSLERL